jgi:CheY-like chemotaxis protein
MSMQGNILVADDDAAIRTVLNQALSRAGYEVRSTGNAATLWRWVSQGEGDLVITDVVMPDENAFDLLPRIKKAAAGPADHRHERAEHVHDRDPRLRARRLRISAEAVRPEGADRHRRPRAVRAQAERPRDTRRRAEARRCRWSAARRRCRTSTACWRA